MDKQPRKEFATEEDAADYMYGLVGDDGCVDNYRFAFEDDSKAVAEYHQAADMGCCGSHDEEILVGGREALIGCNFGH